MKFKCISIIVILLTACTNQAKKGKQEALLDIQSGNPKIYLYGEILLMNQDGIFQKIEEKYNIEIIEAAGCIITDEPIEKWNSYNSVVETEYLKFNFDELLLKEFQALKKNQKANQSIVDNND